MDDLRSTLPHLIVLAVLIIVLLVVLTKFQWIHCSEIPQWCNIYCDVIMRSHSKIALISGDAGIGNPAELEQLIMHIRPNTYLAPFNQSEMSIGLLKGYDLLVLEHMKSISSRQADALVDYVDRAGSVLWIGDAATENYTDPYDLLQAQTANDTFYEELDKKLAERNETMSSQYAQDEIKRYHESPEYQMLNNLNTSKGFGRLAAILSARYDDTVNASGNLTMKIMRRDHLITRGLKPSFGLGNVSFAKVKVDPSSTDVFAFINYHGTDYPAIFETRYAGKVIFVAVPLESVNSTTLINNIFDYLVTC